MAHRSYRYTALDSNTDLDMARIVAIEKPFNEFGKIALHCRSVTLHLPFTEEAYAALVAAWNEWIDRHNHTDD